MAKSIFKSKFKKLTKQLSVNKQLSFAFALTIAIIIIVNLLVFAIIDRELEDHDEAYASNKYKNVFACFDLDKTKTGSIAK